MLRLMVVNGKCKPLNNVTQGLVIRDLGLGL